MSRGFTLIELLVVIAIIAVLAAILFPVFTTARDRAKASKCQAQMKQIGEGFAMYLNDYSNRWPSTDYGAHIFLLEPYLRQARFSQATGADTSTNRNTAAKEPYVTVWLCPSAPKDMFYIVKENHWGSGNGPWRRFGINQSYLKVNHSYVVNNDVAGGGEGMGTRMASEMPRPSKTVLMGECCYWRERIAGLGSASTALHPSSDKEEVTGFGNRTRGCWCRCDVQGSQSQLHPRHSGGANFLWADGHIGLEHQVPDLEYWKVPRK